MRVEFAAKRLKIIAQGFSPGNGSPKGDALKGRPIHGSGGLIHVLLPSQKVDAPTTHIRSPFQGDSKVDVYPGLKPWAVLLDHFMVKAGCVATTNHQSPITHH
jgi:hypothetical protein